MKEYLISATSECPDNQEVLDYFYERKTDLFFCENGLTMFKVKVHTTEEKEQELVAIALLYQRLYNIPNIEVWKKSSEENKLFNLGFSHWLSDKSMELLLGYWQDWNFFKNNKNFELKDNMNKNYQDKIL